MKWPRVILFGESGCFALKPGPCFPMPTSFSFQSCCSVDQWASELYFICNFWFHEWFYFLIIDPLFLKNFFAEILISLILRWTGKQVWSFLILTQNKAPSFPGFIMWVWIFFFFSIKICGIHLDFFFFFQNRFGNQLLKQETNLRTLQIPGSWVKEFQEYLIRFGIEKKKFFFFVSNYYKQSNLFYKKELFLSWGLGNSLSPHLLSPLMHFEYRSDDSFIHHLRYLHPSCGFIHLFG